MSYTVYQHISPSGKSYIGLTKQIPSRRWSNGNHYKSSPHFYAAIKKYGWDNFEHIILHTDLTLEEACEYEQYYIKELSTCDPNFGYNYRTGGETGSLLNEECREKQVKAIREYWSHPENREKRKGQNLGKKMSDEARENMSRAKTGIKLPPHTEEWKSLMREIMVAKYKEDPALYKANADRMREIGISKSVGVVQLDKDGKYIADYESAHDAEKATGIPNGNIRRVCNGKGHIAGGYRWLNAIDYIKTEKS